MSCFGSSQLAQPESLDPFASSTGGREQRQRVFGQLGQNDGQVQAGVQNYANALQGAATDPHRAASQSYVSGVQRGDYLNGSPALDNAMAMMRQGSASQAANDNARIRGQFAQNGMSFGTGNQEAQQANESANTASANQTEAGARLQNYQAERQMQNLAPQLQEMLTAAPVNYLAQIPQAWQMPTQELGQEAQIIQGLSQSPVATPTPYTKQGWGNQIIAPITV